MFTSLKVLSAVIITLLLGVIAYLSYTYFTEARELGFSINQTAPNPSQTSEPIRIDKSQAKKYQGEVFCIHKMEKGASLALCTNPGIIMKNGKSYELIFDFGVSASKYTELQKVEVVGVISPGNSLLLNDVGTDGVLGVFEISEF